MSDRKYRQRGYQDEPRPAQQQKSPAERPPREFRAPSMPGFKQTIRCARCGNVLSAAVGHDSRCNRCGVDLWACVHCQSFDTGARFECREKVVARVTPKDQRNTCELYHPTVRVERETGSTAPTDARKAFDDLFKF
jgi:phage FluMu protein Com